MFESLKDESHKWLVYMALVNAVRSNWGKGFHNHDQGHLAYRAGRNGEIDFRTWGDSPEHNTLYRMMKELSDSLSNYDDVRQEDIISSWKDFCIMATEAFDRQNS